MDIGNIRQTHTRTRSTCRTNYYLLVFGRWICSKQKKIIWNSLFIAAVPKSAHIIFMLLFRAVLAIRCHVLVHARTNIPTHRRHPDVVDVPRQNGFDDGKHSFDVQILPHFDYITKLVQDIVCYWIMIEIGTMSHIATPLIPNYN